MLLSRKFFQIKDRVNFCECFTMWKSWKVSAILSLRFCVKSIHVCFWRHFFISRKIWIDRKILDSDFTKFFLRFFTDYCSKHEYQKIRLPNLQSMSNWRMCDLFWCLPTVWRRPIHLKKCEIHSVEIMEIFSHTILTKISWK